MGSKIVIILSDKSYYCDTIKKVDNKLIDNLIMAHTDYPVNVVIYKNEHSNNVHFATNQGRKFSVEDGTRGFYFNEFYNDLAKESVQVSGNGN